MRKRDWSCMALGLLLTAAVSCRPITEEDPAQETVESATATIPATVIAQQPTNTPDFSPQVTSSPPPFPTPEPTRGVSPITSETWKLIGGESTVLEIAAPPEWVNLSGRIDVSEATGKLGLIVLLLAESERTGSSILAGKELSSGAFVVGLIGNVDEPVEDPLTTLAQLVDDLGSTVTPNSQPAPLAISLASTGIDPSSSPLEAIGAWTDVTGDPGGFFTGDQDQLRTRISLFPMHMREGEGTGSTQAILLQTAVADEWIRYSDTFALMVETLVMHDIDSGFTINEGTSNVQGVLIPLDPVTGRLETGVSDIWTFDSDGALYATLTLNPVDDDIDLTMTILNPSGETVSRVDNGYAGDTEVAADVALIENGSYVVEIGEFFNDSGQYTLNLILGEDPLFSGQGQIRPGQGVQSELPANARHAWIFEGTAGQEVSIILTPGDDRFDAILHLYGPDGERLVALDEGFSGDAEVISGYVLPVTGRYTIQVRSFAGNGGVYALTLDEGGEGTLNFFDAGDLTDGDVKTETLRPKEAHAWFFEGRVGDEIAVEVIPKDETLDLDIWLLDPTISKMAAEDSYAAGEPESIEWVLSQDGQYLVLVRDFYGEAGAYEVRFSSTMGNAPDMAGTLSYGETVTGTLSAGQSVAWRFQAKTDDLVSFILSPLTDNVDLMLFLQDPVANTVLESDTALAGDPEEVTAFKITSDGQWRIIIREFFDEGASYTLTINKSFR